MRKIKGLIIGFAAAVMGLLAASCAKEDNTLRYSNPTMGNIVDGVFTSDQGNIFNVVEQTCPGKLDTMKRAFIICDVLGSTAEKENEYDVRVNYIANVLTKEAVAKADIENIETYMNDPIVLSNLWISGGYINMYLMVPVKRTGGKTHEINLIHEQENSVYKFMIRHNAEGEVIREDGDNSDLAFAYAYASFPITSIIEEETAKIEIKWNSYMVAGSIVSAQSKILSVEKDYKKSQFEQVPTIAATAAEGYNIE